MKNKAYNLTGYTFVKDDVLLLDANIWLYLFPAPSDSKKSLVQNYSAVFKDIKIAKATLVINSLILSEYLNRYIRLEWSALHKKAHPDYKKFRQSSDYSLVGQHAAYYAKTILKFCVRKDDGFSVVDIGQIMKDFETGVVDFNDGLIVDSCLRNGWKLVTHDGDFTDGGIEVLTANSELLRACS
jgi:predicted nucleic acid-binding protein